MDKSHYNLYRQNAAATASPAQLSEMMYTGTVRFLKQALVHLEDRNLQEAHNNIVRTQDILEYMAETLNEKVDVSFNLAHLYDYAYRRLIDANVSKDPEIVQEVLTLMEELRDAWHAARQQLMEQAAAVSAGAGRKEYEDKLV